MKFLHGIRAILLKSVVWDSKKKNYSKLIFHTKNSTLLRQCLFQFISIEIMSLGLRVEDRLDEHSNCSVWKEGMKSTFEEAEVWGIMVHT